MYVSLVPNGLRPPSPPPHFRKIILHIYHIVIYIVSPAKEEDLVTRMKKTVVKEPQKVDREVALVRDGGLSLGHRHHDQQPT